MSSERKIDPFSALILVLSIIGIILIAALDFAAFYYTGYGERFSCLGCSYSTPGDLAAQILMIIFLVIQVVIVLNDLVPKRFIEKDLTIYGLALAFLTFIFVIIGIASFGIEYAEYDWWPLTGFYAGIIVGLLNTILFFLKYRNK